MNAEDDRGLPAQRMTEYLAEQPDPPQSGPPAPSPSASSPPRKRIPNFVIILLVAASVALPVVFWRGTWFGTRLSDEQLSAYLADRAHPRKVQHALVEYTRRVERSDASLAEFDAALTGLVDHPREEVRSTLAWTLGWNTTGAGFQAALQTLLRDDQPLVRRNAALALSKYGDASARGVLRAMLVPYRVTTPHAGAVSDLPPKGRAIKAHTDLALIAGADGKVHKLKAPLNGKVFALAVANGDTVAAGDALCEIAPGQQDLWESLRALAIIGTTEDLPDIESAMNRRYMEAQAAEQAEETCQIIRDRAEDSR